MTTRRSTSCRSARGLAAAFLLGACAIVAAGCASAPRAPARVIEPWPEQTDVVGRPRAMRASSEDTFPDIARRHDVGYLELLAANPGVDPWLPGTGREIVLPTDHLLPEAERAGIVINVAEQRLYWFRGEDDIVTHPIGAGREGYSTPLGVTKIVRRKEHPTWTPGPSARREDPTLPAVVKAGPENPLGDHALYLAWPSYLIHGTNEPDGVGRRVSRGCIRLYPEDIAALFAHVPMGTQVRVVEEPVKLGRHGDDLVLEAHWTLDQANQVEETGKFVPMADRDVVERIVRLAAETRPPVEVDWDRVARVLEERRGVPVRITGKSARALARTRPAEPGAQAGAGATAGAVADTVRDAVNDAVWRFGQWLDLDDSEASSATE